MELLLSLFHLVQECLVPFAIIPPEGLPVFEQGFGRLPVIGKGVIPVPEMVLQEMDFPPQPGEKLPILPFRQMELPGQVAGLVHRPGAGSVHRRQPFGQKGNRLAFFCGPFVRFQLLLEERNCLFFTRSAQQFQQIIIPAIVRHQGQIFLGCFRGKKGQPMEDDPDDSFYPIFSDIFPP